MDASWRATRTGRLVLAYVTRAGYVESHELAYSTCRFAGCQSPRRELGCATLTDGVWLWPEGLAHYLEVHAVRPPHDFVAHIMAQAEALDAGGSGGRREEAQGSELWPLRHHLLWDSESGAPVPLPRGTAAYLAAVSTLWGTREGGQSE